MTKISPYSHLNPNDQEQVSLLLADVDTVLTSDTPGSLEKLVADAPPRLSVALLSQALPSFIKSHRTRHGVTPTLHELRLAYPDLAEILTQSYPWIPASYQLPIEIRGYRILSVIGEGGQSVVLRAQDDVHSAVAIKVSTSVDHNELVLRERKLLGECDHPGIIQVINSGSHEGRAYFVMPHLRGANLVDRYSVRKPTAPEAVQIMVAVCSALTHLHSRGIVHRDIKPANIWLDESGEVKLIDLGMAVQRTSWSRPLPAIAEFNGTPAFMSPEQASSDGSKDSELSDVFSAGATLYWMLTGSAPFASSNATESISLAAAGKFDKELLFSSPIYPQALKRLCLKAMSTESGERFASAAKCCEQLSKIPHQTKRFGKSTKALAAVALISLVTAAIGIPLSGNYSGWITDSFLTQQELKSPEERISHKLIPDVQELRWIDSVASSKGIELASIQPNDFQVLIACPHRDYPPWGTQKKDLNVKGKLSILLNERLIGLAEVLEYRLGEQAWKTVVPSEKKNTYVAVLGREATAHNGPVEIRFASDIGKAAKNGVGPFRFEIDVAQAIVDDETRFGRELLEEAATAKCFDISAKGWDVREEFSYRFTPIIKDFWFGINRTTEMSSLSSHLTDLIGVSRNENPPRVGYNIRQAFAIASKDIQSAPELWVKFEFSDGSTLGPTHYKKPPAIAQEELRKTKQWLKQSSAKLEMADLHHSDFRLTGLGKVESALTTIIFLATYNDLASQQFSGDSTENNLTRGNNGGDSRSQSGVTNAQNKKKPRSKSLQIQVELNERSWFEPIKVSPIWDKVYFKGRFKDGTFTPVYNVKNSARACGVKLPLEYKSEGCPEVETYAYLSHKEALSPGKSISRFLPQSKRQEVPEERLHTTRFRLFSSLPKGAASIDYFADKDFKSPVSVVEPGMLYVRYRNKKGKNVGHSSFSVERVLLQELADHALGHLLSNAAYEATRDKPPVPSN